jgi:hypothetical protein
MTPLDQSDPSERWVARAARHDLRLPIRYRLAGQTDWHSGETINISKSGVLFSSNQLLELDAQLEIVFQSSGIALPHSSRHRALVVRRLLSNWPETRVIFGARFSG